MHQIAYFGDLHVNRDRLRKQLASLCEIEFKPVASSLDSKLGTYTVFDIDLNDPTHLLKLKDKLKSRPKDAKVVFVTDKTSRLQDTRAFAIGATDVIHRPVDGRTLLTKLWGEARSLADETPESPENSGPGVVAAADTLRGIFSAACTGGSPTRLRSSRPATRSSARSRRRGLRHGSIRFARITARPTSIAFW